MWHNDIIEVISGGRLMVRTIVSLPEADKAWLDAYSHRRRRSQADVIRHALRSFRRSLEGGGGRPSLRATAGLWKDRGVNSLEYVRRLRADWDRR
jgi:hypothetical protein